MRATATPLAVAGGILMLALAVLGLPLPRVHHAAAITNCDTNEAGLTPSEQEMLSLVNAERAQAGVGPLKASPSLNRAAAWKSADRSASGSTFSHQDSLGRWPATRAQDCGYPSSAGENIAYGYSSAAATLTAWMGSPGHRANILMAGYTVIGLGQHGSAWTTDFGYVDDSGAAAPPPPPPPATNTPTPSPTRPAATATTAPPTTAPPTAAPPTTAPPTATPTATSTRAPVYPASGVRVELEAGVNFVTYAGTEQPAALAFATLEGRLRAVYEWNAAAGRWEKYVPGSPAYVSTFATLKPGRAYLVELSVAGTWVY